MKVLLKDLVVYFIIILEDLLTYSIYESNEYNFIIDQNILIVPVREYKSGKFTIEPGIIFYFIELPNSLILDTSTGEIRGKCNIEIDKMKFTIKCKNKTSEITITVHDVHFITNNENLILSNNKKTITHGVLRGNFHSYLNLEMINGVYHLIYRTRDIDDYCTCYFGATSQKYYHSKTLFSDKSTCCFSIYIHGSELYGENGNKKEKLDIKYNNYCLYHLIFDMNEKEFRFKADEKEITIFTNINGPLYPFVTNVYRTSIDLLKCWKE